MPERDDAERDRFNRTIRGLFQRVPPEEQEELGLHLVNGFLELMGREQILAVRSTFIEAFGVRSHVLDLIDGHLALQRIQRND